ncbi:bifunctional metallophosphatase/5'-nucleotidase [Vagococcus silagei]|uniref:Bifunctional metallophosphatase/5'-nucleotidase n=1 Tax=Vagococcus silagei TaxID=2508885 RepID=A0A4V3TUZ1_9ENTE|nr:bifunctional UDP-sugar hydrolase/5'-nucleotidase [Vagococcus silagei]THB60809.1 bifunctional metallophosphatase/5'-nucleotidase [Vagococcus silagei]
MKLKIYYTSDVHGYLFPTDYSNDSVQPLGLLSASEQYQRDDNTLVIDGGDMFQGSPFVNYFQKKDGRATGIIETINKIGYDVVTLGNHDFNHGFERLESEVRDLNPTVTCVNVLDKEGKMLFPEIIKEMPNGLKVGIVGITTEYINVWEKPENIASIQIVDPFPEAKAALERIKDQVDIAICLYHGGFEIDIESKELVSKTKENIGYRLARDLDFDLLLTGHQHQTIPGQLLAGTYIVQPTNMARNFYEIELETTGDGVSVTSEMLHPTGEFDQEKFADLIAMNGEVNEYLDQKIGSLPQNIEKISHLELALKGNDWIRMIASVEKEATQADIAVVSSFNALYPMAQELSIRDVLVNYPYENILCKVKLTGTQLKEVMEKTATYFVKEAGQVAINPSWISPKLEHYNYDFYFGLDYAFDLNQAEGSRVTKMMLHGKEVAATDEVTIALNDYRASAGGEYTTYNHALESDNMGVDIQQLVIDAISNDTLPEEMIDFKLTII